MTTMTCDLTAAVELARLAPSVHNTQPWTFRVDGDALVMSRDSGHRLPALDPTGRQQVLSCGAALHLARLALRVQGFDSTVTPLATLSGEGALARVVPVAGHRVTSEDVALAEVARTRHTQRGPFDPGALPADVVDAIRTAGQEHGVWVRVVDRPDDLAALTVLLARADDQEREDATYQAELAGWTDRPPGASVGMPSAATPDVHQRASNLRMRDFRVAASDAGPSPAVGSAPPEVERPLALVLGTEQDTAADWLRAGSALMAVLLRAAVDGVQAQPLGQVIDREWTRARLGAELGVVGHPQMVLRMGYGRPGADTPRRPVAEVLETSPAGG
jgi:nitroreductase